MIVNPATVDAYLAEKGLTPRISDAGWDAILERITSLFGTELWYRCRLIHQAEDVWRRYSTKLPDSVPRPYRFIYYFEFVSFPSPELRELQEWLNRRDIIWRECRQIGPESEQEEVAGLQIFGYEPFRDA